ncbi:MAG: DUF2141 domain-containing protein [Flavobacteriia bacterium]|nr:DUF2141 domain-containing protein [Flavobacteriia bacterium]OIP46732.1 MAG: hypothetical protein AUK46_07845 [Flavobacteriaceae bacterium CG2_30_31_66]PIV95790.1 MAG: hypothetical protein COW43_11680 [Flavobacteriaceae bacterium CG17_big_fil_post_rev_8_21_14_2_50_31_13]PIX14400.1 MAG: hypothetical protein COZ74_03080 [Flavobacteriaceae bacterium CG_4_8_14_3_um_filter_31_8]PIY16141.1 MAG: hypothetical protein COZ16_00880 [Flavobacteriaceae bacterium CG_4_10_14_3_um_filter_31_253]PIZ11306.1 M
MKKNLLIITFICFGILTTKAQEEETFDLTVEITGITTDAGKVFIAVYDKQENFLKDTEKSLKTNVVVENKKAIAKFKGLKKGEYAISIFHDENDNNKMDTKIFGIPKEPYGFSNNATGFMGPPKFEDAKFLIDSNKTIQIKVN